jgi:hypothetical protein
MKNKNVKYFYNNISLYCFCTHENLPYQNVASSLRYILKKNNYLIDFDKAIDQAIKTHIRIKDNRIIIDLIKELKQNIPITKCNIKSVCKDLHLSSKNISYITKKGYDHRTAIIVLYYYSDKLNNKNEKIISTKLFNKIIFSYKSYKNNINEMDLKIAILLYCANIDISRNEIFELLNDGFILKKARKIARNYNINNQYIVDIISDINLALLNMIDLLLPYEKEQIYKYINLKLKTIVPLLVLKYKNKDLSLDAPIYYDNSNNCRTLKNFIVA